MNEKRKPISLIKPGKKRDYAEYDENGYKILTPSHNVSEVEIYPEYHCPVEHDPELIFRSVPEQEKESFIISEHAMSDKMPQCNKELIHDKMTLSIPADPEQLLYDKNETIFGYSCPLPPVYDDTDDFNAKLFIVLNILFLLLYVTPVFIKPSNNVAFAYIVITLLLSALSCIFIFRKSNKAKKILLSVLRVLTLSQICMSTIGAVVGYYLI